MCSSGRCLTRSAGHDGHCHFELHGKRLDWSLVARFGDVPVECAEKPRHALPLTSSFADSFAELGAMLRKRRTAGPTWMTTEHWFPPLWAPSTPRVLSSVASLVVIFREPLERLSSSYTFHGGASGRCPNSGGVCTLLNWAPAESNVYTRQLSGQVG